MSDIQAKMHQIRFQLGFRPRPRSWSLQRSPHSLAGFKGPTSEERVGEMRGREVRLPHSKFLDPQLVNKSVITHNPLTYDP